MLVNGAAVASSLTVNDTYSPYTAIFTAPGAVVDVGLAYTGKIFLDLVTLVCQVGPADTWKTCRVRSCGTRHHAT